MLCVQAREWTALRFDADDGGDEEFVVVVLWKEAAEVVPPCSCKDEPVASNGHTRVAVDGSVSGS